MLFFNEAFVTNKKKRKVLNVRSQAVWNFGKVDGCAFSSKVKKW